MKGRKPKPAQQQIADGDPRHRGTHKLDALAEATSRGARGLPDAPKHLSARAKAQWAIWKEDLELMECDYHADAVALEGACVAYARAIEAEAVLTRFGRCECREEVLDKTTGEVLAVKLRNHPAVARSHAYWKQVQMFISELGLTLASRQRLAVEQQVRESEEDIMEALSANRESKVAAPKVN